MTLNEAEKIVQIWGSYLEYASGKITMVFGACIPESLLPYPKDILLEALNIMAEKHHQTGNQQEVKLLRETAAELIAYVNDEEALLQAAKNFNDPKWREAILPALKDFQNDWIKAQQEKYVAGTLTRH